MTNTIGQISGMPRIDSALRGWKKEITLGTVTQTVNNEGLIEEVKNNIVFKGTIQPLSPEAIQLKPEGERSWEWLQIHANAGILNLNTGDSIYYQNVYFKVMAVLDYSINGFVEYHVIKDFQN